MVYINKIEPPLVDYGHNENDYTSSELYEHVIGVNEITLIPSIWKLILNLLEVNGWSRRSLWSYNLRA